MITYPLAPPATPTTSDLKLTPNNIVGESVSPFTGSQQILQYPGEWWEAEFSVPPLYTRSNAEPWLAFLASLRGKSGSFYLGDPAGTVPRGSASSMNFVRYPIDYTQTLWTKNQCTVTSNQTLGDPISGTTASELTPTGGATDAYINQLISVAPGQTYSFSVYLKVPSGTKTINFYAQQGIVGGTFIPGTPLSCALTTSWQRFSITLTPSPGNSAVIIQVGGGASWTAGAVDIWIPQVTLGSTLAVAQDYAAGPRVHGAGQTGTTLAIWGFALNQSGTLLRGDYVQLGTGATQRLYKVLTDASADSSGAMTLDMFPRLRESPNDGDFVTLLNCKGTFRMAENPRTWQLSNDLLYQGISLRCKEAI